MDQLARSIYRLIGDRPADGDNLSVIDRTVNEDWKSILRFTPEELAAWLAQDHLPAENWLTPPPIVID